MAEMPLNMSLPITGRLEISLLSGGHEYPVEWPDAARNGEMESALVVTLGDGTIRVRVRGLIDG